MELIKQIYRNSNIGVEEGSTFVCFYNFNDKNKFERFLNDTCSYDTDLSYEEVYLNLVMLFSELGLGNGSVCLHDMKVGTSKYDINQAGICSFNYSVSSLKCNLGDVVEYYSSGELFDGSVKYVNYPGVKLTSGDTSLYYTLGSVPYIRKYDIQINDSVKLIREFSKDEVLFMFEGLDSNFIIRIKKPSYKSGNNDYVLDNELIFLDYLRSLSSYDMVEIYNKLCELCLGKDISVYPEITICQSIRTDYSYYDTDSITIKNGDIDVIVRTVGDKSIICYGNGNWNYILSDENVTFKISSGKTLRYKIETKTDKEMDEYTESLLKYDVNAARSEVEDTKKLIREKLGLSVKKRG